MKERLINLEARALSRETAGTASGRILTTQRFTVLAKSLGLLGTALGVYDLFVGLSKAQAMQQGGELRADVMNQYVSTGLKFVGGVVIGLMFSSFLIGLVIGLGLLYLSTFFDPKHLVPQCLQRWLRRSKFGQERETVQGRAFRDMSEEQDALRTVLRGITVSMDIETISVYKKKAWEKNTVQRTPIIPIELEPQVGFMEIESVEKNVMLTVSVPKDMKGVATILFGADKVVNISPSKVTAFLGGSEEQSYGIVQNNRTSMQNNDTFTEKTYSGIDDRNNLLSKGAYIQGDFLIMGHNVGPLNINELMVDDKTSFEVKEDCLKAKVIRKLEWDPALKGTVFYVNVNIDSDNQHFSDVFRIAL